ncbi:MAG: hypothetical protein LJE95_11510 [Acidobacteria bacterium]|jgi:hypothetical protein|nr:hypothetical protein [Acidobacteriota bacterium]
MTAALLLIALQAATAMPSPTPTARVPSPVVERIVTRGDSRTRLSLFDNRVAVVSLSEDGVQTVVRRRTLSAEAYLGYLAAVTETLPGLDALEPQQDLPADNVGVITLHVGEGPERVVRYATLRSPKLALGRLLATLDDLQTVVMETKPAHDRLAIWEPRRGDRLRMVTGQTAVVVEVHDDGGVVVEYEDVGVIEYVAKGQRDSRILELLERPR